MVLHVVASCSNKDLLVMWERIRDWETTTCRNKRCDTLRGMALAVIVAIVTYAVLWWLV